MMDAQLLASHFLRSYYVQEEEEEEERRERSTHVAIENDAWRFNSFDRMRRTARKKRTPTLVDDISCAWTTRRRHWLMAPSKLRLPAYRLTKEEGVGQFAI